MLDKEMFIAQLNKKIEENLKKKDIISYKSIYKIFSERKLYLSFLERENRVLENIKKMVEKNHEDAFEMEKSNDVWASKMEKRIKKFLKTEICIVIGSNFLFLVYMVYLFINAEELKKNNFVILLPVLILCGVISLVMSFHLREKNKIKKEMHKYMN